MTTDKEHTPDEEQPVETADETPNTEQPKAESREETAEAAPESTEKAKDSTEKAEEKDEERAGTEAEIARLQAEVAEQKDKYLRLYSEFENYRRRTAKERAGLIQTAGKDIMLEILPILDDFARAEKSFPEEKEGKELDPMIVAIRDSVKLIHHKLRRAMEQKGLKPMESSVGQPFDADIHEAITQIPAPSEEMKGKVVDEIERGYYLGDKILRFAKVVVGA